MSLNSKKSWHPSKAINRAKVQKAEEDELAHKQELDKQADLERLRSSASADPANKASWIYETKRNGPNSEEITDALYGSVKEVARESTMHTINTQEHPTSRSRLGKEARKQAADPLNEILKMMDEERKGRVRRSDSRLHHTHTG